MKFQSLSNLFQTAGEAFRRCAKRFPLTVAFVLALTVYLFYIIGATIEDDSPWVIAGYFLSVGTVLSLSIHLWGEEVKRKRIVWAVHIVAQLLLAVDSLFLYSEISELRVSVGIAHGAALLAIGLSVSFLSFFREKDDVPAWYFAVNALGTLATVIIIGAIMHGGLSLLLFSLEQLFGVPVSGKNYAYIAVVCFLTLPSLLFLGLLPQGERKHERRWQPSSFLNGIIRYLFLPLAGLYLLVLYLYVARIIIRWELPDGWVSWLVTVLMLGCIGIEFGLYPSRLKEGRKMDERIARWLPLLVLPLLLLMTVGIARRFMDYGITIKRLYLVTLNLWFYFVCIKLIVERARRISWIPISFSIVFLLTSALPVNYAGITRSVLRGEIEEALVKSGNTDLPLSEEQYEAWLRSLPKEEAEQVHSKIVYLIDYYGGVEKSVGDLLDKDISFTLIDVVKEDTVELDISYYTFDKTTIPVPQGYRYCTLVRGIQSAEVVNNHTLYIIPLDYAQDTLCIPVDTLCLRDKDKTLPPPVLQTRQGNRFVLTSFDNYGGASASDSDLLKVNMQGYLYHNATPPTKELD